MAKRVLAIDLDEVLGQFVRQIAQFHNAEYGTDLKVSHFCSYMFHDVWGGTIEEATEKVHQFFRSPYFRAIPTVPGAAEALKQLRSCGDYRLFVVTSRQLSIETETRTWIDEHFPGVFEDVLFGNHFGTDGRKRSKSDMCREIGADILIDDAPGYALDCASAGMNVILFNWNNSYPWGWERKEEVQKWESIHPATNWTEALAVLKDLS